LTSISGVSISDAFLKLKDLCAYDLRRIVDCVVSRDANVDICIVVCMVIILSD